VGRDRRTRPFERPHRDAEALALLAEAVDDGHADAVEEELGALARRELVQRLSRRPGERGERWQQLLGADEGASLAPDADPAPAAPSRLAELEERIAALEARLDAAGL
jgi:uncharacterized protein YceH (UPF0502 family)